MKDPNVKKLSVGELLSLTRSVIRELKCRGVIRTTNSPTGDYAEWLVKLATGGELEPNSAKSWDVRSGDGRRIQVKSRVSVSSGKRGSRQLSAFRTWDFDDVVIVLFGDDYEVLRATRFSAAALKATASRSEWVRGDRVIAGDALLDTGEDMTVKLKRVAKRQDHHAPPRS